MTREMILQLLENVKAGATTPASALHELAVMPYEDTGFARIDHHRALRLGLPEVIYAAGKTPAQVAEIFARMAATGGSVLATRADAAAFDAVKVRVPEAVYHEQARIIGLHSGTDDKKAGPVAVVCAGTSDLPVAEEAATTAESRIAGRALVRPACSPVRPSIPAPYPCSIRTHRHARCHPRNARHRETIPPSHPLPESPSILAHAASPAAAR